MKAVIFEDRPDRRALLVERPDPLPGTHEVLVKATHAGLNPADLLQRDGKHPPPPDSPPDIPGLEVAGTVDAIGPRVTRWRPGDRVFGIVGGGGLSDMVCVPENQLARVPDNLDDAKAAAVPEVFVTAHDAVFTQARLGMGETLLVNGANGGVGTAAVQLGLAAGARVLASVRTPAAAERLRELGAEPVALADARGVDVILELVGASNLAGDFEALATSGRIIVVGTGGGSSATLDLRALMGRRATLVGTLLRVRSPEEKAAAMRAFARAVVPLLALGRVWPVIERVVPADHVQEALEHLASPGKFGKVLLQFG